MRRILFAGLSSRFGELAPVDQLGVFYDTTALALVGDEPLPDILMLAAHLRPGMKPAVARAIVTELGALESRYVICRDGPRLTSMPGDCSDRCWRRWVERVAAGRGGRAPAARSAAAHLGTAR